MGSIRWRSEGLNLFTRRSASGTLDRTRTCIPSRSKRAIHPTELRGLVFLAGLEPTVSAFAGPRSIH